MPNYKFNLKRRLKRRLLLPLIISFLLIYIFRQTLLLAGRDFIYLTRPIWDSEDFPENITAHYHSSNLSREMRCSLHGWTVRDKPPRVIDAVIFSNELDMLEIRMRELWDVVDTFIVVEADLTFTGRPKLLYLQRNKERFAWAAGKLAHFMVTDLSANPQTPFQNEAKTRGLMTNFIHKVNPHEGDLIITGDVDELPYRHTIQLLRTCQGYPRELHLELQDYIYSFEFRPSTKSWRPRVETYNYSTYRYHHGRNRGNPLLADAGWHCSFCFRKISDFIFKMNAYSHNDRVTKEELLERENIQRKVCEGRDIFDMLPEAYTFKQLITQWGRMPKTASTVGIPEYIVENPAKFRYLLPGGCVREDNNQTS